MDLLQAADRTVDQAREELVTLSHAIHGDAEVGFEEHTSSRRVADALDQAGFAVTHGVGDLDTAVVAEFGAGPLTVSICAEYDALPGIGHACGHNIIAAAGVGAALALAPLADELGLTVRLLGTPAEEGGGGKVLMMRAGSFDGTNLAMMVHPAPYESASITCLAVKHVDVRFRGTSAHASAYPELGVNAADALTVAQVAIGLLRQHIRPTDRIHGIVTDGGDAPNIVPERAGGQWYARAQDLDALNELYPKVLRCFQAGALATGAEAIFDEPGPAYTEFRHDPALEGLWELQATQVGRTLPDEPLDPRLAGSTDMANVSIGMPAIHPMLAIETDGAVNHQPGFTAACIRPDADRAVRDGAAAMARTTIAAATDEAVLQGLLARSYRAAEDPVLDRV